MKVKLGEDLPRGVASLVEAQGHETTTVLDQGMRGWPDHQLWDAVQAEGRFFGTADKGFGDVRHFAPGAHAGVLLLRPDQDGIRPLLLLLQSVFSCTTLDALGGCVAVATPRGVRVRRPGG